VKDEDHVMLSTWLSGDSSFVLVMGAVSVLLFLGTLALIPAIVIRIPADYFNRPRRDPALKQHVHPWLRWVGLVLKNCIGWLCILAGLAMLILPGQGLLTIVVGLMLIDFPGKFGLERRLVCKPRVFRSLNWIRLRAGKPALQAPQ
jgi:hypothetical protein